MTELPDFSSDDARKIPRNQTKLSPLQKNKAEKKALTQTMFPHQITFTSWEIASSSYHILDLLALILVRCEISFPFKYNCL